jgi:hypothetical protein
MHEPAGPARLADPQTLAPGIDTTLVYLVTEATRALPSGWQAEIVGGRFAAPAILPGRSSKTSPVQHSWGLAIDVRLIDGKGRGLAARCRDQAGPVYDTYRQLADLVFIAQRARAPTLEGRLAWGGKFTTADGQWDVGHFDLGGFRGRGIYRKPEIRRQQRGERHVRCG